MTTPLRLLVIFEGGGAKGIAHIGAMKALEEALVADRGQVTGVAGTSAGAIVAALYASGYRADELIDPDCGTTCLKDIKPGPSFAKSLFGVAGWRSIAAFRMMTQRRVLICAALLVVGYLGICWTLGWFDIGMLLLVGVLGALAFLAVRGFASLDSFRDGLNGLLAKKIRTTDGVVRFQDFGRKGLPTLKIVATDISTQSRHVFSPETTPCAKVADAVAASACLPLVFGARKVDDNLYFDGGFVSNLPVWLFDVERILDADAITVAVSIEDDEDGKSSPSRYNWLPSLVRTAVFGRNFLNTRGVGRLQPVLLPAPVRVLDFDIDETTAFSLVRAAADAARDRIRAELFDAPRVFQNACEQVRQLFLAAFNELPDGCFAVRAPTRHIRVAVAWPEQSIHSGIDGKPRYLRLQHGAGFDDFADEGLTLPLEGSIMGAVWGSAERTLSQFQLVKVMRNGGIQDLSGEYSLPGSENRRRRKLVWPDLAWILAVPIWYEKRGVANQVVISVDGNDILSQDASGEISSIVSAALEALRAQAVEIFAAALQQIDGDRYD